MVTVETILKSVMKKWRCMTYHRVCNKGNTTGPGVEQQPIFPPEHLCSLLSKYTLRFRIGTISGSSFQPIGMLFLSFFGSSYILRCYLYLLVSNMISMSDDVSLVGQEVLTLPQDLSNPPVL